VRALYANIAAALNAVDADGRRWGDAKFGVYCFYDFDGEPIYVGQTREQLRTRIRRHLTNQRTDAVAMFVLDPYEVHAVEMWPFWHLEGRPPTDADAKAYLNRAEWTVYEDAVNASRFAAVLNEGDIHRLERIDLPPSYRHVIAPDGWEERNEHPDVRLARRAQTIWQLAKVASERNVSKGLRRTLVIQAQRLLYLAGQRYADVGGDDFEPEFGMRPPADSVPDAAGEPDAGSDVAD
jgi:hypothetical protein